MKSDSDHIQDSDHTPEDVPVLDLNAALPAKSSSPKKPRGKSFQRGNRLGKGRPLGSRNKNKLFFEELSGEYGQLFLRKLVKMGLEGDRIAVKLITERIIPVMPDDRVELRLRPIRSRADVGNASATVIQAVSEGAIGLQQASGVLALLEAHQRIVEKDELERRIIALEQDRNTSGLASSLEAVPAEPEPAPASEQEVMKPA